MANDIENILEMTKLLTGSIMTYADIIATYNTLHPIRKKDLYSKIKRIIGQYNVGFDKAQPLFVVDINIMAAEEGIDPAVLILVFIASKSGLPM